MFMVAGVANALWGISALVNDDYFTADELLFGDLSMWGVFYLLLAAAAARDRLADHPRAAPSARSSASGSRCSTCSSR